MKKNRIIKISFLIIFLILGVALFFIYFKDYNNNKKIYDLKENYKSICETNNVDELNEVDRNICIYIYPYKEGFIYTHEYIMSNYLNIIIIPSIVLLIVTSIYYPCRLLKSKVFINELLRIKYSKIFKRIIRNSYYYIIPVVIMILIIFALEIYYFGYDNTYCLINNKCLWLTSNKPLLFIMGYLVNLVFYLIGFINIGLISVRKYKKYFLSLTSALLSVFIIELLLEVIFKSWGLISIINIFTFYDRIGIMYPLLISFIFAGTSTIIMLLAYKSKENLVLEN